MPTTRKRGAKWQTQVRVKEDGVIVFQESQTFDTKGAGDLWGLQLEQKINREGYQTRMTETTTLRALMEMYADQRGLVKKLGRGFEHSLHAVAYGDLGLISVRSLTSAQIIAWAMTLHAKGNAPATVMHHLATLSAAWNAAPVMFNIQVQPEVVKLAIARLKMLRVAAPSKRRERRLDDAELRLIADARDLDQAAIDLEAYMRLAVALPRRREELLTIEKPNVDRRRNLLKLFDTKDPNGERDEVIPLLPHMLAAIDSMPNLDDRWLLPYKPESVSAAFQRAVKRAGVLDARLHDLRHEGISRLFELGLSIEEVALISGHTSWATLKRYTHLRPEHVTEKFNARRQREEEAAAQSQKPGPNRRARARRKAGGDPGAPDRLSPP